MKSFFKIIKRIFLFVLLMLIVLAIVLFSYHEPLPKATSGSEADALAEKMLEAVKHDAYKATNYIEWTFKDMHHYKWVKNSGKVEVYWDDHVVSLDLNDHSKSEAFTDETKVIGNMKTELTDKALAYFNNDSFWLVAPHKVFDTGTKRGIVTLEDGSKGLLVTYTSGGTTPGDSYLWILNENGLPKSYKMWVKIIPVGGLEATWEGWKQTRSGTLLPTKHKILFLNLDMGEVMGM
ncbi:hypothetical protein ACFQ1M_07005 [Sungkyunkwania multivorans]|uniref:Uncharacterized protein n=1 Tax=Sungkyunkwania multivorans TaxID=1173618 RepID=A0ABW3CW16_9FLAO